MITGENLRLNPIDYESLASKVMFINTLRIIITNDKQLDIMINDLIAKCQKIIDIIDQELNS